MSVSTSARFGLDDAQRPLLCIDGLEKVFRGRRGMERLKRDANGDTTALKAISLAILPGESVGVVGESGSGKTTLARSIVRLVRPDAGSIEFDGEDLLGLKRRQLAAARRRIQMVYQDPYSSLNPAYSVGAAIAEPIRVHRLREQSEVDGRVAELLDQVGLPTTMTSRRPRELSGGQRQRVAIARALAAEPEVLIADEAVSALDVSVQAQVLTLFERLQGELGLTMIFVSHQLAAVAQVCSRVVVMYRGEIVEDGPTAEVFERPRHGYTVALLQAHPGQDRFPGRVASTNMAPSPSIKQGLACAYVDHCPFANDVCSTEHPDPVPLGNRHNARCHVLPSLSEKEISDRLREPRVQPVDMSRTDSTN